MVDPLTPHVRILSVQGQEAFAVVPIALWRELSAIARATRAAQDGQACSVSGEDATTDATHATSSGAATTVMTAPSSALSSRPSSSASASSSSSASLPRETAHTAFWLAMDASPAEVLADVLAGEHPLKAWRHFRRLTSTALARSARVSASYITLIETGRRQGTMEMFDRIAAVLNAPVAALTMTPLSRLQVGGAFRQREPRNGPTR